MRNHWWNFQFVFTKIFVSTDFICQKPLNSANTKTSSQLNVNDHFMQYVMVWGNLAPRAFSLAWWRGGKRLSLGETSFIVGFILSEINYLIGEGYVNYNYLSIKCTYPGDAYRFFSCRYIIHNFDGFSLPQRQASGLHSTHDLWNSG